MTAKLRLPGATVATVVAIVTDTTDPVRWTVHDGVAPPEVVAPFIAIFPLDHARQDPSLASEDWGTLDAVFQVSCFGATVDQARWLAEQVLLADWPQPGWDLVEPGAPVVDNSPAQSWQFVPLTFRYHG